MLLLRIYRTALSVIMVTIFVYYASVFAAGDSIPEKTFGFGSILFIEPSSDQDKIFIGSNDGKLRLWDVKAGSLVKTFTVPINSSSKITMGSDNSKMMIVNPVGSNHCEFSVWDLTTGSCIDTLTKPTQYFASASASKDFSFVHNNIGNNIKVWDFKSGDSLFYLEGPTTLASAILSPDGSKLFAGFKSSESVIIDLTSGDTLHHFSGDLNPYSPVTFLSGGSQMLGGDLRSAKIWNTATGAVIQTFPINVNWDINPNVILSPDESKVLTVALDSIISLWDKNSGALIRTYQPQGRSISMIRFTDDSKGFFIKTFDNLVKFWDIENEAPVSIISEYSNKPASVKFLNNSQNVLVSLKDRDRTDIWDIKSGACLYSLEGIVTSFSDNNNALSPDSTQLVTVSEDSILKVWKCSSGDSVTSLKMKNVIRSCSFFNTDSTLIALIRVVPDTSSIILINISHSNPIRTVYKRKGDITGFTLSPDYSQILIVKDSVATLRNLVSGDSIMSFTMVSTITSAKFSPDQSKIIFTYNKSQAETRDVKTGLRDQLFSCMYNTNLAFFSPDGKFVLTTGIKIAQLWDAADRDFIKEYKTTTIFDTYSAEFSSDGRYLLTGSDDGVVRLWNLPGFTKSNHEIYCNKPLPSKIITIHKRQIVINSDLLKMHPEGTLKIFTFSGRILKSINFTNNSNIYYRYTFTKDLPKGTLIYRFTTSDYNLNGKIIISE